MSQKIEIIMKTQSGFNVTNWSLLIITMKIIIELNDRFFNGILLCV